MFIYLKSYTLQVYVGDKEYSLEEIRSRKYDLEKKFRPVQEVEERRNEHTSETLMQCSALETLANCALDSENDHMSQLMPLQIPSLQNVTKVNSIHSPGEPKVLVNLDSKELSNHESKKDEKYDKENQMDEGYNGTNYPKNNLMEEFNRSLMGNLLGDSVTVNTKEARWELRNIFNDNNGKLKFLSLFYYLCFITYRFHNYILTSGKFIQNFSTDN